MRILIILLAIVLFFLSTTAEGADWKRVAISKDDNQSAFVDTESIKHISKTVVRAWVKHVYKEPKQSASKYVTEIVSYKEYDCSNGMENALQVNVYYKDGTNDSVTYKVQDWQYIIPDTVASAVHNYLCKRKKE